ncbi:voltage-gated chloride channel-like protein [Xylaria nigripes]|nr:voltage-gated chloride channel-like protein [Xylaria nigripes]
MAGKAPDGPVLPSRNLARSLSASSESRRIDQNPPDETTALLRSSRSRIRIQSFEDLPGHPRLSRTTSVYNPSYYISTRHHSRPASRGPRLLSTSTDRQQDALSESKVSIAADERIWYNQFTSTDWVHDGIADAFRVKKLRGRKDWWGRLVVLLDGAQGWILSAVVGFLVALVAYCVDISETTIFDFKDGYCARAWYVREELCCPHGPCTDWRSWSEVLGGHPFGEKWTEFFVYLFAVIAFSAISCLLTLTTKTIVPSAYRMSTFDENLAAEHSQLRSDPHNREESGSVSPTQAGSDESLSPPMVYYSAAGSGVAEVRVIISGFVLHGFLGFKTLVVKSVGLIISVASGLSLGKEGPYVHISACIGNICCRIFDKYDKNDAKRREVLSAAAAAGIVVAFGAPLGGVLFGLEEVAYYFPAKTLFRTFFCCIVAALSLKFLNPYGTHKIVMFEVRYKTDWQWFELAAFIFVGMLGGAAGALFIKASRRWALSFRKIPIIKRYPLFEVVLVAFVTGLISYWNTLTKLPVAKLLLNLTAPCEDEAKDELLGLCPSSIGEIPSIIATLLAAFIIKGFLTTITFGIKVPSGIYVPSMVVGGLMGRIVGHMVQWVVLRFPHWSIWGTCPLLQESSCVQPGVYALIAAGATMCGVTRLSVTLAVILFELTGSLDYVLPFSLGIQVAKWTADALEPLSIYDLLTIMNSYPYLDNKHKPIFTGELDEIVPRFRHERVIDVTTSPLVPARSLRAKLELLHRAGELDGGFPILRDGVLIGLIPAPDLEYALDNLKDESSNFCRMAEVPTIDDDEDDVNPDPTDFTRYIDPAPVALDINSPIDLVYECFAKLGLRYICVLRNGRYAGMTHKKQFVKYVRELAEAEHRS